MAGMGEPSNADMVKELRRDLAGKYSKHGTTIQQYWRGFNQSQRTECIKAGAADGVVLKHPLDRSLGNVYKIIPEINLRDITEPNSDFLLDLLKHRATTSLVEQYSTGLNDYPGDYAFIKHMMDTRALRLLEPRSNGFTLFLDEEKYGESMEFTGRASQREEAGMRAALAPAIRANLCVPQELGELILQRQLYMLQSLNVVIEDILDIGSQTRDRNKASKKSKKAATAAMSKLRLNEPAKKLSLPELVNTSAEQKDDLEEYLAVLSTEPVVLAHDVNLCFFTRPELLPDEKGRSLPVHTDSYISGMVLEAVHNAVKAAAIWNYISRLLDLLTSENAKDKIYTGIILQEISNVCHMEYGRSQAVFKRHVQTAAGEKLFKRVYNAYDKAGNARVNMKGDPEDLVRSDPQLSYMLRLCQPNTGVTKASDWIKKLNDLHAAHPSEYEKLSEREVDALSDLAVIASFVQGLSSAISMPSLSRKQNQMFVARVQDLDAEMNVLKSKVDLRDFVVPIDNLLEPGVASRALSLLDHFIIENAGTTMGFLYQDLIDECFVEIERQYTAAKDRAEQQQAAAEAWSHPPSEPQEKRVEQRKLKQKTRPAHASIFGVTTKPEEASDASSSDEEPPAKFKVRASTADVFSTLFSRHEARGSLSWSAFVAAMTDLGFSVRPKTGSIYGFYPPESMEVSKALALHRPHGSEIESYHAIWYASRLRRVYGWTSKTFEVE